VHVLYTTDDILSWITFQPPLAQRIQNHVSRIQLMDSVTISLGLSGRRASSPRAPSIISTQRKRQILFLPVNVNLTSNLS